MLSRRMKFILYIFDVCGYCTGTTVLSTHKWTIPLIFILHFTLATYFVFHKFYLIADLSVTYDRIEVANLLMKYATESYTYWLILLDSLEHREHNKQFWNIYAKIDEYFCIQDTNFRYFLIKFIGYIPILIILFTLNSWIDAFPHTRSLFLYLALVMIVDLRVFYYIFCLDVLQHQLKTIEKEYKFMVEFSDKIKRHPLKNLRSASFYAPFELKRFKWTREYIYHVHEMVELLNKIFGWSQVCVVLLCFYNCAGDLFWFYGVFEDKSLFQVSCKSIKICFYS